MQNNPLLSRLVREARMFPLWLAAVFAVTVMIWDISAMLPGLAQIQAGKVPISQEHTSLFFGALLVLLGTPVMVAVNGAVFTSRHSRPENLKKIKLGGLSRKQHAWAYTLSAMHRMRVPIALAAGLAPALALGSTETMLTFYNVMRAGCATAGGCPGALADPVFNTPFWLTTNALVAAGVLGFIPLGAALGAWSALTWKQAVVASAISVVGIVAVTVGVIGLIAPQIGVTLPAALVALLGPWLLAWAILLATGWERLSGQ